MQFPDIIVLHICFTVSNDRVVTYLDTLRFSYLHVENFGMSCIRDREVLFYAVESRDASQPMCFFNSAKT